MPRAIYRPYIIRTPSFVDAPYDLYSPALASLENSFVGPDYTLLISFLLLVLSIYNIICCSLLLILASKSNPPLGLYNYNIRSWARYTAIVTYESECMSNYASRRIKTEFDIDPLKNHNIYQLITRDISNNLASRS
jgi:hypothetical protein